MESKVLHEKLETLPWLLFRLKGQAFAVPAGIVDTVFLCDRKITELPDTSVQIRGILDVRGALLPMIELRMVMGLPSAQQEYQEFVDMLEQRKIDHINWVKELERCIDEDSPFRLATDPHQCAFGQWYDHYESPSVSVMHHLRKIDQPHQALHNTAEAALKCKRLCDSCTRETCLKKEASMARDLYMPQVINLLEEAKEIFLQNQREMCVTLLHDGGNLGILVDEVIGMELLGEITGTEQLGRSGLLLGVASRAEQGEQVLLLDSEGLVGAVAAQL